MRLRTGRRRSREPKAPRESDPHGPHRQTYQDFLGHARWLIEVQERRSAGFQQGALAVLGFDGIILAILVDLQVGTAGALVVSTGAVVALLVLASATSAVLAFVPRSVAVASTAQLLKEWRGIFTAPEDGTEVGVHPAYLAATLLSQDIEPPVEGRKRRTSERGGRTKVVLQPLEASAAVAEKRAWWLKWAAWLLLASLLAMVPPWLVNIAVA